MISAHLADNLLVFRHWHKWTRHELAKEAGVSVSLVVRLEASQGDPRLSTLEALARALKVTVPMLLSPGSRLLTVDEDEKNRFYDYVHGRVEGQCWWWSGGTTKHGYGVFHYRGGTQYSHRIMYAMTAPLPDAWTVDHTCCEQGCVNPAHLTVCLTGKNLHERDNRRRPGRQLLYKFRVAKLREKGT